jgi:F0F1-type ATP synthase assembly protein I
VVNTGYKRNPTGAAVSAGSEGWGFYASIFSGVLLGWGADRWLGTDPIFLVVGLLAGSGVGFWKLWLYLKGSGR